MADDASTSDPGSDAAEGRPDGRGSLAVGSAGVGSPADATAGALLLAQIRAVGYVQADASAGTTRAASAAAASVDRKLIEISDPAAERRVFVLGWADGTGPDPDQHPSAPPRRLSAVPNLVWAVCLAAAWPDPAADPYPGLPFRLAQVLQACTDLGAARNNVISALRRTLPGAGLITLSGQDGRLGLAAAALPSFAWSALRRVHERLPHAALPGRPDVLAGSAAAEVVMSAAVRALPVPPAGPAGGAETVVHAAVTVLETARGSVARSDLPWLADPAIRRAVQAALAGCGRALVPAPDGGWTTGYLDPIAQALAKEQAGTLTSLERAVLALILLRTVAIPRAQGRHHHDGWAGTDHPVTLDELGTNRQLSRAAITSGIRGLRTAGYVATTSSGGYIPGPALARLSTASREALWEDLVLLARPDGYMAEKIRARRNSAPSTSSHHLTVAIATGG